jgi:hypothetical protein
MALPQRRDRDADPSVSASASRWTSLYEVENLGDVAGYVSEHPTLIPVLAEAPDEIAAVFGHEVRPYLRLNCDAEDGDCWLTVGIPVTDPGPAALPFIDALDERWWLSRMQTTDAVLVFDVVMK